MARQRGQHWLGVSIRIAGAQAADICGVGKSRACPSIAASGVHAVPRHTAPEPARVALLITCARTPRGGRRQFASGAPVFCSRQPLGSLRRLDPLPARCRSPGRHASQRMRAPWRCRSAMIPAGWGLARSEPLCAAHGNHAAGARPARVPVHEAASGSTSHQQPCGNTARDVVRIADGTDGPPGNPLHPIGAHGQECDERLLNGTLPIGTHADAVGAFLGRRVSVAPNVTMRLDSSVLIPEP
jgi:hypothetical protein